MSVILRRDPDRIWFDTSMQVFIWAEATDGETVAIGPAQVRSRRDWVWRGSSAESCWAKAERDKKGRPIFVSSGSAKDRLTHPTFDAAGQELDQLMIPHQPKLIRVEVTILQPVIAAITIEVG